MTVKKVGAIYLLLGLFLLIGFYGFSKPGPLVTPAKAAAPQIYIQSSKTSFLTTDQITATVIIDGGGQTFTSFKADIRLTNLSVVGGLTLGPNVTNWQTQPTTTALGFFGGVQGTTTNITVYTMTLKANAAGAASITLNNGAIYQVQEDGITINDILASQSGASYTVSSPPSSSPAPTSGTTTTKPKTSTSTKTTTPKTTTPAATTPSVTTPTPQVTTPTTSTTATATAPTKDNRAVGLGIWLLFFYVLIGTILVLVVRNLQDYTQNNVSFQ